MGFISKRLHRSPKHQLLKRSTPKSWARKRMALDLKGIGVPYKSKKTLH